MIDLQALTTFRELDQRWQARKGTAFRAFKHALVDLQEGTDFLYLHAQRDAQTIASLRAAGRIHATSVNVVLLSATGTAKLREP